MQNKIALLLLHILVTSSLAQSPKTITPGGNPENTGFSTTRLSRIDDMVEEHIKNHWIPGAVVLIARHGKIVYHRAYGYSNTEKKTPLKKDDIFRIASQSKAITSTAVMMLWEEGKLLLDDPLSNYIPEFKDPTVLKTFNAQDTTYTTEPAKGEITIRQLLTHTSGIDYAGIGSKEFKAIYAKAGLVSGIGNHYGVLGDKMKILGKLPLKHHPGERWTYGLNTDVLGYLVEVVSGMPLNQFFQTRIFSPLGMNDTYFYLPKEKHSRLVGLHEAKDGKIVHIKSSIYDNVTPEYPTFPGTYFSGGAGLSSTVEDYARFLQLFLNKGEYNGKRLLGRKTIELMLTDQIVEGETPGNEFGLSFALETPKNDHLSPLSLGSFSWGGAYSTHYWADPKEDLIGMIFTNVYATPRWGIGDKFKNLTYQAITD